LAASNIILGNACVSSENHQNRKIAQLSMDR